MSVNVYSKKEIIIDLDNEQGSVEITINCDNKPFTLSARQFHIFAEYADRFYAYTGEALDSLAKHGTRPKGD